MVQARGVLTMTLLGILQLFGVDNCSSSHTDNFKNEFLVLGEGPTDNSNGSVEDKVLILVKER